MLLLTLNHESTYALLYDDLCITGHEVRSAQGEAPLPLAVSVPSPPGMQPSAPPPFSGTGLAFTGLPSHQGPAGPLGPQAGFPWLGSTKRLFNVIHEFR